MPGDMLAGRYRIAGLLERGGMGEVYRADDLKLSQPVALKFLPESFLTDAAALARFHREVRVARQVSHPNVCRVYDIGEADGQHFISMEYIRGEELGSSLKRFGRLPPDKAVEIARQLCAGLAAAHKTGVLHRDLKPANVMIDGEGNARITDFGLAALAEEVRVHDAYSGTPAYMSPEQLAGGELTTKSDIYSLGLVLYELFTGKRTFQGTDLAELLRLRRGDATPTNPSSLVKDLDPVVERVVMRCLEKDPARRPASALQVAAALPGGDPLAAALEAGETPSPEMVAAAPRKAACARPWPQPVWPHSSSGSRSSSSSRNERCCTITSRWRSRRTYSRIARARSSGNPAIPTRRWIALTTSVTAPTRCVTSRSATSRRRAGRRCGAGSRRRSSSGSARAPDTWFPTVSTSTRLSAVGLHRHGRGEARLAGAPAIPRSRAPATRRAAAAARAARLVFTLRRSGARPVASFKAAEPRWIPEHHSDARAAWEGVSPGQPQIPLRIEAAAYRGRPVYFKIIYPWDQPYRQMARPQSATDKAMAAFIFGIFFIVVLGGVLLAWRNARLGRGDRKGAFRLALFMFTVNMLRAAVWAHHVPSFDGEFNLFIEHLAMALLAAALLWVVYVALEPFVRARWPHQIISWSQLLGGDWRDPLVGRDLLIGGLCGVALTLLYHLQNLTPGWLRWPPDEPAATANGWALNGIRGLLERALVGIDLSLVQALGYFFIFLLLFILLRRDWLAAGAGWVRLIVLYSLGGDYPAVVWGFGMVAAALTTFVLMRFGLLSLVTLFLFSYFTYNLPITMNLSAWYGTSTVFVLVTVTVLAAGGFYLSLGGQRILRGGLLPD